MQAKTPLLSYWIFKRIVLIIPCLCLLSCAEPNPPDPNAMEKIELTNTGLKVIFSMPAKLKAGHKNEGLMTFRLKYPSMEAADPYGIPQSDEISVWVELLDLTGSTESMVAGALSERDPNRPGAIYQVYTEGLYEVYRHSGTRSPSEFYVFRSEDGALVGAEDPGDWSHGYKVRRKIDPNLQIQYSVAKPLGRDFIQIDQVLTAFIKRHRQTNTK